MAIVNPKTAERDARRTELARLGKARLAQIWKYHRPNAWTAHPVHTWHKEEIIGDILDSEFGPARMCGAKNETGARCVIGAATIHDTHRHELAADVEVKEIPDGTE